MLNNREIYSTDLPHRAIAVYMYLRDRANKDGACFPAINTNSTGLENLQKHRETCALRS